MSLAAHRICSGTAVMETEYVLLPAASQLLYGYNKQRASSDGDMNFFILMCSHEHINTYL